MAELGLACPTIPVAIAIPVAFAVAVAVAVAVTVAHGLGLGLRLRLRLRLRSIASGSLSAEAHGDQQLIDQKATAFATDCIPRTLSRGQTYDALSSQANITGYRAVVEASDEFGCESRFCISFVRSFSIVCGYSLALRVSHSISPLPKCLPSFCLLAQKKLKKLE